MIYHTIENERLDQIVYRHYGTLEVFEKFLELIDDKDLHLLKKIYLTEGEKVVLPDITLETTGEVDNKGALWS